MSKRSRKQVSRARVEAAEAMMRVDPDWYGYLRQRVKVHRACADAVDRLMERSR